MSVVEQVERIATGQSDAVANASNDKGQQIKDLEEVEAALREVGVTLEPRFDISLTARIGAAASKKSA